ncbi:MAG: DUF559 domain-containing protein [Cyclobacteriaceae bacterium]
MSNELIPYKPYLRSLARDLRKGMTLSEVLLWQEIRKKQLMGYQFHRQVPMLDYILDFYCHELKLAIEIDGATHDLDKDKLRDKRLAEYEVAVLRFDDKDVKSNIREVLNHIYYTIEKLRKDTPT